MPATQSEIGLIGLAVMGENVALNIESRGFPISVFNRTTSKVDDFVNGRAKGKKVSHIHLRYLNPLPADLADKLRTFKKVMIAEMNMGQLLKMVRADYLIPAIGINKIQGRPFKVAELVTRISRALEEK